MAWTDNSDQLVEGKKHYGEYSELESLILKFASEKIEPENVSESSDEELSRLGLTTISDRHRLRALCANAEK